VVSLDPVALRAALWLGSHFLAGRPLRLGAPPEIVVVDLGRPDEAETQADGLASRSDAA